MKTPWRSSFHHLLVAMPGRAPLDLARQRERRAPHLIEGPAPLDAHVDVDAARARGLGPTDQSEVVERRLHHARDLAQLRPLDARHRVEVGAQLVGMIEILGPHRMRMELEAGEVGHPGQRRGIARHHLLGQASGREGERHHLDPLRARLRRALLVEELALDSVRVAHQHVGSAAGARAARRAPPRGSSGRRRAWCSRVRGRGPCAGSRSRPRGLRSSSSSRSSFLGTRPPGAPEDAAGAGVVSW